MASENIDGNLIYYKIAIGKNFDKYAAVAKVYDTQKNNPISWHWPALFFGPMWVLYRKMYGIFFIYIVVVIVLDVLTSLLPIMGFALLGISVFFALFAKSTYVKHISKKIASCEHMKQENRVETLSAMGGTLAWVPYLAVIPIVGVIVAIAIPQFAKEKKTVSNPASQEQMPYSVPVVTPSLSKQYSEFATLSLSVTNSYRSDVTLGYIFYDDYNKSILPSDGQCWKIMPGNTQSHNISCKKGEKVCFGAFTLDYSVIWGIGIDKSLNCTDCCISCDDIKKDWRLTTGNNIAKPIAQNQNLNSNKDDIRSTQNSWKNNLRIQLDKKTPNWKQLLSGKSNQFYSCITSKTDTYGMNDIFKHIIDSRIKSDEAIDILMSYEPSIVVTALGVCR